jgi:pimeloyl-ACP methyl ester carboxylesterase
LASGALFALALMRTTVAAQDYSDPKPSRPLHLRGYGSFFLAGRIDTLTPDASSGGYPWFGFNVPGGQAMINQMYVQYMLPQKRQGKKHFPVVFVHGGILSSKSWQTTPDGQTGWDEYFVHQGLDTYLADQVGRAHSGFDARRYNMVRTGHLAPADQPPI